VLGFILIADYLCGFIFTKWKSYVYLMKHILLNVTMFNWYFWKACPEIGLSGFYNYNKIINQINDVVN